MTDLFTPGLTEPDANKDYLQDLVGEGKKYPSFEEAARALAKKAAHADPLIETLTKKQDELRSDYLRVVEESKARAKLEDLINQMDAKRNQQSESEYPAKDTAPSLDVQAVEELFSRKFQETEKQKIEKQNFDLVESKLKERYGRDFANALKEQIADLGMSQDEVNFMARKNPRVLIKALGLEQKQQAEPLFPSSPRSNTRPEGFRQQTDNVQRTWSYYQKMKETDPKRYYSPKTNVDMVNDQIALGDAFQDGDFSRYGR
jgi:hypothetical protein